MFLGRVLAWAGKCLKNGNRPRKRQVQRRLLAAGLRFDPLEQRVMLTAEPPTLSIGDVTISESNGGSVDAVFTVTLSDVAETDVTFDYATANGTATAGSDYTTATGSVTIPAGTLSTTLSVAVLSDTVWEPDEVFSVNLSNLTGATFADASAECTIQNDDPAPITMANVSVTEGNSGTVYANFVATLPAALDHDVTFDYATADGTAAAGSDYTALSGHATIAAGTTTLTLSVAILGDTTVEPSETFYLNLSNVSGAVLGTTQAVGTITTDDLPFIQVEQIRTRIAA